MNSIYLKNRQLSEGKKDWHDKSVQSYLLTSYFSIVMRQIDEDDEGQGQSGHNRQFPQGSRRMLQQQHTRSHWTSRMRMRKSKRRCGAGGTRKHMATQSLLRPRRPSSRTGWDVTQIRYLTMTDWLTDWLPIPLVCSLCTHAWTAALPDQIFGNRQIGDQKSPEIARSV